MQIFLFHKFQSTFLVAGQMSFLKTTVDQPLSKKKEYRYLAAVSFEALCQYVKMTGGPFAFSINIPTLFYLKSCQISFP